MFGPPVRQELAQSVAVVFVARYLEQDILHPFSRVNAQRLATVHQGVDDGGAYGGIVVPAYRKFFLPRASGLIAFSTRLLSMQKRPSFT